MLSKATGVRIIANTGLFFSKYVYRLHGTNYEKELAERWIEDFEMGLDTIDGVIIRPSHIKIFISRGKLPEVEKKILSAAVTASKATGLPIHCHIIEAATAQEVFDFLETIGYDPCKFLWAHASYEGNKEAIKRAVSIGIWMGFDMIKPGTYPKYCTLIKEAVKAGYQDRILLSQDLDFYDEVIGKGNTHPCASIFTDFIPYCEENGLSKDEIYKIMSDNPANFYNI
jgi:phosphotriesterase-related protein